MLRQSSGNAFCCSAGGGRIMAEEKLGEKITIKRVKMAHATGASTLVANCPFCLTMFEYGVKGAELDGQLVPKDIVKILAEPLAA
jgi:Fe-S oxidoreductase